MKIQDDKSIRQAIKPEAQTKTGKTNDDFKKILSGLQSKATGVEKKNSLTPDDIQKMNFRLQNASATAGVELSCLDESICKFEGSAVEKVEQSLHLLESYASALADPQKSLKDLDSLIQSMESEKEKLSGLGKRLPDGHVLKDLINQAAILTTVEVIKFNRGDYL